MELTQLDCKGMLIYCQPVLAYGLPHYFMHFYLKILSKLISESLTAQVNFAISCCSGNL